MNVNNNQRYAFHPYPAPNELRLVVTVHGALTIPDANRLVNDLGAALAHLAQLANCDAIEIDPCVGLDANGTVTPYMTAHDLERYPTADAPYCAADIACWTVYGHLRAGGAISLLDFQGPCEAEAAAAILTPYLGRSLAS